MADDGFTVREDKVSILREYAGHIERVFGVTVSFGGADVNSDTTAEGEGGGGLGAPPHISGDQSQSEGVNVTLRPVSTHQGTYYLQEAKAYIDSLTIGDDARSSVWMAAGGACGEDVRLETERRAQAVLQPDGQGLLVWGPAPRVQRAQRLLNKVAMGEGRKSMSPPPPLFIQVREPMDDTDKNLVEGAEDQISTIHLVTLSPGHESNHDSCYDSDMENSSLSSRTSSMQRLYTDQGHSDVSRTTSDTLAAEHSDTEDKPKYQHLTPMNPTQNHHLRDALIREMSKSELKFPNDEQRTLVGTETMDANSTPSLLVDMQQSAEKESLISESLNPMLDPQTASQVEFALKLGYSEQQIHDALASFGHSVSDNNQLLNELISIGSSVQPPYNGLHPHPQVDTYDVADSISTAEVLENYLITSKNTSITQHSTTQLLSHDVPDPELDFANLRPIVIDGSNVAMSHGNKTLFSCRGIMLAVDWFRQRGHTSITVFVPQWRKEASRPDTPIIDQDVLYSLEKQNVLVFTPARWVAGRRVVCYDDRYIIKVAAEDGGIVVSNDNYRDLMDESVDYRKVIEERLLMYSFVNDRFMPPDDPLGRHGPRLDDFLQKDPKQRVPLPPICPYGRKCTYGHKCKYHHPERGPLPHKLVTEKLAEQSKIKIKEVKDRGHLAHGEGKQKVGPCVSSPAASPARKMALTKTKSLHPGAAKAQLGRTQSLAPNLAPQTAHHSLLPASLTSPNLTPQVTVSAVDRKYDKYNEHLSQYRRKMEAADAEEHGAAERRLSLTSIDERHGSIAHSLKPPEHLVHDSLRQVHSDPARRYDNVGQLGLAKKLSDEGSQEQVASRVQSKDRRPSLQASLQLAQQHAQESMRQSTLEQNMIAGSSQQQPVHRKLQRQLSLKGSDDPRIVSNSGGRSLVALQSNTEAPRPQHDFGDLAAPKPQAAPKQHPQLRQTLSEKSPSAGNFKVVMGNMHAPIARRHTAQCNDLQIVTSQPPPLLSHSQLSRAGSHHSTLTRLGSAPVMRPSERALESTEEVAEGMSRQNSSSDPQLNTQSEGVGVPGWQIIDGTPVIVGYRGMTPNTYEHSPLSTSRSHGGTPLAGTPQASTPHMTHREFTYQFSPGGTIPNPQSAPPVSRHPATQLGGQHTGGYYHSAPPSAAAPSRMTMFQMPNSGPTTTPFAHNQCLATESHSHLQYANIDSCRTHNKSPDPGNMFVNISQTGHHGPELCTSNSPSLPQQMPQSMPYPPSLQQPAPSLNQLHHHPPPNPACESAQYNMHQTYSHYPPPMSHSLAHQQQTQTQVMTQSQPVSQINQMAQPLANPCMPPPPLPVGYTNPPPPQTQPTSSGESPDRQNLFYHLCGIFPEDRVRCVLAIYPNETCPETLCKYLLNMKEANQ